MKKILLFLFVAMMTEAAFAQHVTNYNSKIASILYGKPKSIMEISNGVSVCMTEFDESGRVISEKVDKSEYTFKYEWTESQIILSFFDANGRFVNKLSMDYKEDSGRFFINVGTGESLDFYFNENGTMNKLIGTTNRSSSVIQFGYDAKNPFLWNYYAILVDGKVEAAFQIETGSPDSHGNWTEFKSTGDHPFSGRRKITYYE